jgi:Na+-transporting methylmalonyl-CoA/oxaloacetate decarboxylase beta subunit
MRRPKIFKIAAFISGFLALFTFFSPHLMKLWLTWRFGQELGDTPGIKEATSIGIIGGADGPTSIYLSSSAPGLRIGITGIFLITGLSLYLLSRKK